MNVLSLFNGMGCAWLALEEAGIKVNKRYSSEIEKYPNQANDLLYPDTIQLGDVRNVDVSKLEKIDFLCGGSPCQSFSFAGKRKGMSAIEKHEFIFPTQEEYSDYLSTNQWILYDEFVKLRRNEFELLQNKNKVETIEILTLNHYLELKEQNFEFEGQSYLFWEFIRILTEIRKYNPDVKFLLENVIMGSKWQKVITQAIGINPIRINSALVSAQNRDRLYWTNIAAEPDGLFGDLKCAIPQPKDKGILLKDILESEVDEKYFLSDKMLNWLDKHAEKRNVEVKKLDGEQKGACLTATANFKQNLSTDYIIHNMMPRSGNPKKGGTGHLTWSDGKTYCLDTGNTNAVEIKREVIQLNTSTESGGKQPFQQNRVYDTDGLSPAIMAQMSCGSHAIEVKSGTLRTHNDGKGFREVKSGKAGTIPARAREDGSGQNIVEINKTIRRLTPRECGRLQTVSEDKLELLINSGISDTQLYRAFGNGWTIDVIAHIVQYLKL